MKLWNVFAYQEDGRWLPWDAKHPAYAFSGTDREDGGAAIAHYLPTPRLSAWSAGEVSRAAIDFTFLLHSVSNGRPIKPGTEY